MTWRGPEAKKIYRRAAVRALGIAVEAGLTEANRTVPIEETILERSGATSVDETRLEAAISYDTKYARRQHEDTRLAHDPGRRAKWLQLMLQEKGRDLINLVGSEMKKSVP